MPIVDYHDHLSPEVIAGNKKFENLTKVWLNGDHYKWRAMRINGVDESFITGDKSDWEENFRHGLKPCHSLCVILCIIGPTWNCSGILG